MKNFYENIEKAFEDTVEEIIQELKNKSENYFELEEKLHIKIKELAYDKNRLNLLVLEEVDKRIQKEKDGLYKQISLKKFD